jgi:hypothetical protein
MRLRDDVIGAMKLFRGGPGRLDETGLRVAQALADVATIGLLQERSLRHQEVLAEQLQGALNSRVVIEQAKGVLAERLGLDMGRAFDQLRNQARLQNRRLAELARRGRRLRERGRLAGCPPFPLGLIVTIWLWLGTGTGTGTEAFSS